MTKTREIYSAYIGQLIVASACPFIVYGDVRGLVSEHRTLNGARRSLKRDKDGCASQGGYSDAYIYEWSDEDGWKSLWLSDE